MNNLDKLLEALGAHAHRVLLISGEKELMPMYHLCPAEGPDLVIGTPWRDEQEKLFTLQVIRAKARELKATALGFVGEVWMTKYEGAAARNIDVNNVPRPSQHPNRIECVMAMVTDGHETKTRSWEIVRDRPGGTIIHLQQQDYEPGMISGRMVDDLLPKKTLH